MLRIRLQRTGRKHKATYRIVVAEHTSPVKTGVVEHIGFYNPMSNPALFELDQAKFESWMKKGAAPSSTVARLLKGQGVKGMEKFIDDMPNQKKKGEASQEAAAGAPAA